MIKAIIFDNDGVLVDSEPLHHAAEKETLASFGLEITQEDFLQYVGVSSKNMINDWIQKYGLNTTFEEISKIHDQNLIRRFEAHLQPMPGIMELLEYIKQKPLKLAVASSSSQELVKTGLDKLGIYELFETVVCGDQVEVAKPDPAIFLKTAQRLEVQPQKCLVIEDSHAGVTAAKAAGMVCIGYKNTHSGNQDLSKADYIITTFDELKNSTLKAILGSNNPSKNDV